MARPPTPAVRDIELDKVGSFDDLLRAYAAGGGFTAKHLAAAADVLGAMVRDRRALRFLAFPAAPVATGLRGVLRDMIRWGWFDIVITTCGTLDHDLARSWAEYHHGSFQMDDVKLGRQGIHRLGNVLVPRDSYGPVIERRLQPFLKKLYASGERRLSTRRLAALLGERVAGRDSILRAAADRGVAVHVPGITDGAVGCQLWLFSQERPDFVIDVLADERELSDAVFTAKRAGALILGGGISKHHTIWWNQFRDGLDYAVYMTTATEQDGSLSGAEIREAVSWGKVSGKARTASVHGEATALLPVLAAAVRERLGRGFRTRSAPPTGKR